MIARLIRWSASNLVLILIGAVFAAGAGLYAVRHVPQVVEGVGGSCIGPGDRRAGVRRALRGRRQL